MKIDNLMRSRLVYLLLLCVLIWYISLGLLTQVIFWNQYPLPDSLMADFVIYLHARDQVIQGFDPYAHQPNELPFLYPLPSLLLIDLFAQIPTESARAVIYIVVNIVLLAIMVRGIALRYGYRWEQVWWWFPLVFFFAPFLELLQLGQINLITSFGVFLMFLYADSRPLVSGFGLALGAVTKLTPLIMVVYLVFRRCWRALIWSSGFIILSYIAASLRFGWQSPNIFLETIGNLTHLFVPGPNSNALVSSFVSLGWIQQAAWPELQNLLMFWVAAWIATGLVTSFRTREWEPLFIIASLGTAVMPNVLWYHHYVFILLPMLVWMAWSKLNPFVVAWIVLGMISVQLDRWYWTQGILPHLFVHLSILGIGVWGLARMWRLTRMDRLMIVIGALAGVIGFLWYGRGVVLANWNLVAAQIWIDANLPRGARIVSEFHTTQVDATRYTAAEFENLFAHSSDWYEREGWEYIVTHYGTHGRFSTASVLPIPTQRYTDFSSRLSLVKRIAEGDYEIRIYKTGAQLPAHRVGAHFGVYPAWIELVGYDATALDNLIFYWRPLVNRREKLTLTTRVLDRNGNEIARTRADLFGGNYAGDRWQTGLVRVPWKIDLPKNIEPGMYRIDAMIDGSTAGRVPLLIDHKPADDHLEISQIKWAVALPSTVDLQNARPVNVKFGNAFALSAFSLNKSSDLWNVSLYWQSIAKTDTDYTMFVHVLDANGKVVAQIDAQPRGGAYPTSIWDVGEIIRDEYVLSLPKDLPAGEYKIEIGAYEYPSLVRVQIIDASGKNIGDHLILDASVKLP
jgi:hypothetical protein